MARKFLQVDPKTQQPQTFISELVTSFVDSKILPEGLQEECPGTATTEAYHVLNVPLEATFTTLKECLRSYFEPRHLVGESSYKCRSGELVPALQFVSLKKIADYLMLGVNRGSVQKGEKGITLIKSLQPLSFPLGGLDLAPYFGNNVVPGQTQYGLVAFIIHVGSSVGGHYNAYIKKEGQWYFCDDMFVHPISNAQIKTIAQRGYAFDPLYLMGQRAEEDAKTSKEQTPILFFYQKYA